MSTNKVRDYIHCTICGSGALAVGWTEKGLQVWCTHCDENVLELDFLGRDMRQVDNTDPRMDEARQKMLKQYNEHIGKPPDNKYVSKRIGFIDCQICLRLVSYNGIKNHLKVAHGWGYFTEGETFPEPPNLVLSAF